MACTGTGQPLHERPHMASRCITTSGAEQNQDPTPSVPPPSLVQVTQQSQINTVPTPTQLRQDRSLHVQHSKTDTHFSARKDAHYAQPSPKSSWVGSTRTKQMSITLFALHIHQQTHVLCGCTTFCTDLNWVPIVFFLGGGGFRPWQAGEAHSQKAGGKSLGLKDQSCRMLRLHHKANAVRIS